MKQKDIATIVVVALIAGIMSFVITGMVFGKQSELKTEVEVVEPISAELPEVDNRYFNENSINPTQIIRIGSNQNNE